MPNGPGYGSATWSDSSGWVVLPIALAVGAIVARWAPDRVRGPLHSGLFASAIMALIALPFLVGAGRSADNPSALPLPYGRGLLIVLAVIWSGVAVAVVRRHVGSRAACGFRTGARPPGTADDR